MSTKPDCAEIDKMVAEQVFRVMDEVEQKLFHDGGEDAHAFEQECLDDLCGGVLMED